MQFHGEGLTAGRKDHITLTDVTLCDKAYELPGIAWQASTRQAVSDGAPHVLRGAYNSSRFSPCPTTAAWPPWRGPVLILLPPFLHVPARFDRGYQQVRCHYAQVLGEAGSAHDGGNGSWHIQKQFDGCALKNMLLCYRCMTIAVSQSLQG